MTLYRRSRALWRGSRHDQSVTYEKMNKEMHLRFGDQGGVVMKAVVHAPRKASAKMMDEAGCVHCIG